MRLIVLGKRGHVILELTFIAEKTGLQLLSRILWASEAELGARWEFRIPHAVADICTLTFLCGWRRSVNAGTSWSGYCVVSYIDY